TSSASFTSGLAFTTRTDRDVTESYTTVTGKQRTRSNTFKETTLAFTKGSAAMNLVVRVSADGIAYRYVLPASGTITVNGESSAWNIPASSPAWLAPTGLDDQGAWNETTAGGAAGGQYSMPALFDVGGTFVQLAESDLSGRYAGSDFDHSSGTGRYSYAPWSGSMSSAGPLSTPWRTAAIGDLKTVTESRLVDDLAPPSKIADTSWIKPGNVAWSWLTDGVDSLSQQEQYIDFAAANGWSAILVDAGFSDSWIPTLVSYGKARNVGIIVWYDSSDLQSQTQRDTILNKVKGWGAVGVKIDYVFDDNQNTMKWYDAILQQTANLHLMVNFHGAQLPKGMQRTWPHVMTAEAVFGAEQKKNNAKFDTILPFTRNSVSSMDFTPVTFSMGSPRNTTDGHELGMSVAFESGWQHYGDNPGSYNAHPDALKLLDRTPTAWDQTILLGGRPAQEAWFARRAGTRWSIGGISALNAKTFSTPLSFLGTGQWFGEVVTDGSGGLVRTAKTYASTDTLSVPIATRGGFASVFCPYTAGMTACPSLTAKPSGSPYVSDLSAQTAANGWGPAEKDLSNGGDQPGDGKALSIGGTAFAKGLGVHAPSTLTYYLGGNCSQFTASVGIDDEVLAPGTVDFQVLGDGKVLADSGTVTKGAAAKAITGALAGVQTLTLKVTDAGDGNAHDHADWGGARLTCA
ncbi:MAG: alpha-glucosidase, partial [Cryptosporangiaceae bacterium]|nr:alpha-glucosidase [Cryptosporangiaceae bacterium]